MELLESDTNQFRGEHSLHTRSSVFRRALASFLVCALLVVINPGTAIALGDAGFVTATLSTQANGAIDEIEPNDDFDQATTIKLNTSVYGQLENGDGPDYYKASLPVSGSLKLTVTNGKHSGSGGIFVYVYDKYYQEVGYTGVSAFYTKPGSKTFSMPKGACYLKVVDYPWYGRTSDGQPYHIKLTYEVPPTSTKAVASTKAFVVKWTKKAGAAKYQLRYSTKKGMSGAKTADVPKGKGSKKITGLKSGKKYYVQVRVVKSVGGETYYSPWSAKKSVKTK